jgi:hypothetical protein
MRLPIAVQAQLEAAEREYKNLLRRLGLDEAGLNRLADRVRRDRRRPGGLDRRARGGRHV